MTPSPPSRSALVTGSARRVGRAIAEGLIAAGWRVVIHATNADRAADAARELGAAGSVGGDLRDPEVCASVAGSAITQLGGLDLLVNNAASFLARSPLSTSPAEFDDVFRVNARAPMLLAKAAVPALRNSSGTIINISDLGAVEHWLGHAAHSASKAALDSLTRSLAHELAPEVHVVALRLGTVLPPDDSSPELLAELATRADHTPLESVVAAVLASADRQPVGAARNDDVVIPL